MSTSATKAVRIDPDPAAVEVEVSDTLLHIVLTDGRELAAPLAWFPGCATPPRSSGGTGS